ncbi:MAG TPA: photosynthetic reaction center subunit H [Hyphomicrobiaceae bacterium]|nr:photosynthetic reaction center subunit H [Hyphomicrobiaceae bacterium]
MKGEITSYFDVAQVTLWMFWIFFAGLILYLLRENKREGYPLESDRSAHVTVQGFPAIPAAKTYILPHGGTQSAPRKESDSRPLKAEPVAAWPGAPLVPTGNPMLVGVGPGSWTERADQPDLTAGGKERIVPLRADGSYHLETRDPDPRGMQVIGADGLVGGTVVDVWVDRSEALIRYLEVAVAGATKDAEGKPLEPKRVLLPMTFSRIDSSSRRVNVKSILADQFTAVPTLRSPLRVTRREEDRICAYYGAGTLYATPARAEPLI